jgi:hypothetical protein
MHKILTWIPYRAGCSEFSESEKASPGPWQTRDDSLADSLGATVTVILSRSLRLDVPRPRAGQHKQVSENLRCRYITLDNSDQAESIRSSLT